MIIHTNTKVIVDFDIVHMYGGIYFFEYYKKSGFGFLVESYRLKTLPKLITVGILVNGICIVNHFHEEYCKITPVYNLDSLDIYERLKLFVDGFIVD